MPFSDVSITLEHCPVTSLQHFLSTKNPNLKHYGKILDYVFLLTSKKAGLFVCFKYKMNFLHGKQNS